jgi:lipoyl(octanoyl) transferase
MEGNAQNTPDDHGPAVLQAYLLGTVDFEAALVLQKRLVYEISGDRNQAALVLCEHPPCITVGRHGSRAHIFFEAEELLHRRWPVRWVNRGGGCMLHLPGQLAIYPILPLERFGLNLAGYLERMGLALQDLLSEFHLPAQALATGAGVFVGPRMVAGFGVAVRDWISYFGAYLNVQPSLDLFRHIRIGAAGAEPMTSLERERRGPVRPSLVRERLLEYWQKRFDFGRVTVFSEHPFLEAYLRRRRQTQATASCS